MSASEIFKWLLTFGAKIPDVLAYAEEQIALWEKYAAIFGFITPEISHNAGPATAEEQLILDACISHGAEHGAIGDGKILAAIRKLVAIAEANPALMKILIGFFA